MLPFINGQRKRVFRFLSTELIKFDTQLKIMLKELYSRNFELVKKRKEQSERIQELIKENNKLRDLLQFYIQKYGKS